MDLALAKTTPVYGERVSIELRAEAFNLFNHSQFRNPDTNPDDTTYRPRSADPVVGGSDQVLGLPMGLNPGPGLAWTGLFCGHEPV
jgi:hypothetical protein